VEQPDPPAELTNPEEQQEHSPEDRDPTVHYQHESQEEKVVPVATDTELDKTREDSIKTGQRYQGESAECKMATYTVDWKEDDGVSMVETPGIDMNPLIELADMHLVPRLEHGEVKDDTTETKSNNMNTNQAETVIDEESHQAKLTGKKPEGKRVVAVVNDEINMLVVRMDMEKPQPDCLEQSKQDILKKSQPDCLMQSQPDCLEQSQSDCQKQTVERKKCGKMTMECMRCGYKRGRLKKRLENHLLKCPAIIEVEEDKQCNGVCDADPKEEPENLVPEPVHAPKSVPPDDTHADSVDNDEVFNVGCEANKFITSSGTGPLYKYLRYEIPTTV
jgi:hypothetical protein